MATKTYHGSCHCGQVRYEADIDLTRGTGKCNCTFCMKARAWSVHVKPEAFRLVSDKDALVSYHKHPQAPVKWSCKTCSIRTHATGDAPWMGGAFVSVFVNTLDDATAEELADAPVRYSDGLHDNWMNPPKDVRIL
ncbi:MAG TPA: GFA family protein [Polyangiaceae bacterium]|nr:GFA family protein [Polyangiaceae bacterium]